MIFRGTRDSNFIHKLKNCNITGLLYVLDLVVAEFVLDISKNLLSMCNNYNLGADGKRDKRADCGGRTLKP